METGGIVATVIVAAAVVAIVFLAARKIIRDKKSGKSSCGCSCDGCDGKCGRI